MTRTTEQMPPSKPAPNYHSSPLHPCFSHEKRGLMPKGRCGTYRIIEKYLTLSEAIADGRTLSVSVLSPTKCSFCRNWNRTFQIHHCQGCPIHRKTKRIQCIHTPFSSFQRAVLLRIGNVGAPLVDMIDFLLELEPTVKSMEASK